VVGAAATDYNRVEMLNIGTGEIIFIAIAALLILGPKKLPEFARTIGKLVRDFRKQTDDVRSTVEREFYKMDQELTNEPPAPLPQPAPEAIAHGMHEGETPALLPTGEADGSQVLKGAPTGEPVLPSAPAPVDPAPPVEAATSPVSDPPAATPSPSEVSGSVPEKATS